MYFSTMPGMRFRVSDLQITSRTFRHVAAGQGLPGFLFNTIVLALSVNIATGLV